MHGPDHLAGQEGVGGRDELEGRKRNGDREGDLAAKSAAPALGQTFNMLLDRRRRRSFEAHLAVLPAFRSTLPVSKDADAT